MGRCTTIHLNQPVSKLKNRGSFPISNLYPLDFRFRFKQLNPVSKPCWSKSIYYCHRYICCLAALFKTRLEFGGELQKLLVLSCIYCNGTSPSSPMIKRHKGYSVHPLWSSPHSSKRASHLTVSNILQKFQLMKPKWQEITSSSAPHFSVSPAAVWK